MQKGINTLDHLSKKIHFIKSNTNKPEIGVYPEDLTEKNLIRFL